MFSSKLFPTIMILLNLVSAVSYATVEHDYKKMVYWLAAATLTYCVTF